MLKDLKEGSCSLVCMVKGVEELKTRTNKPYLVVTISDKEKTEIKAKIWDTTKEDLESLGTKLIYCQISVSIYHDALNYVIDRYREATEEEGVITDFLKTSPISGEQMFQMIYTFAKGFKDSDYRMLVCEIYEKYQDKLLLWGAAKAVHHNMISGLLYHTYRMLQSAVALSKIYPFRNELLYTGVILHDIGKLIELSTNQEGVSDYTVKGSLLGHSLLGCEILRDFGTQLQIPEEKLIVLCHLIASHHGNLQWGAIQEPKITEAFLLHHLDVVDAGMFQLENLQTVPGTFSEKIFGLNNQKYYCPLV